MKRSSLTSGKESILVVDQDPGVLLYTKDLLEREQCQVETSTCLSELVYRLQRSPAPDLILLSHEASSTDLLRAIEECLRIIPEQKIVVASCCSDTGIIAEAIRLGAVDFLAKPFYQADLHRLLKRWVAPVLQPDDAAEVELLEHESWLLVASPVMKKIRAQLSRLAKVDMPVLFLGESGVGKEVFARLVHKLSGRANRPLLKVNCAALPASLLESELFGYEQGAFTGATRSKPGQFELCDKGTIMLDEIGEMSPALQAKLLHVLQDGTFTRLGGRTTIAADFRLLAATNIRVEQAMQSGALREDLYYRLSTFTVNIPPLRERKEEIEPFCRQFMQEYSRRYSHPAARFSPRLLRACLRHRWPGNLRELGNFVKRYMVLQDENLAIAELEAKINGVPTHAESLPDVPHNDAEGLKSLVQRLKRTAEPRVIEEVLSASDWNCKEAAAKLKISYKALLYKIKEYQLGPFDPNSATRSSRGANGRH